MRFTRNKIILSSETLPSNTTQYTFTILINLHHSAINMAPLSYEKAKELGLLTPKDTERCLQLLLAMVEDNKVSLHTICYLHWNVIS